MKHLSLRKQLIEAARSMDALGINQGRSGNVSVRIEGGLLITPSGMDYDLVKPGDVVRRGDERRSNRGPRLRFALYPLFVKLLVVELHVPRSPNRCTGPEIPRQFILVIP